MLLLIMIVTYANSNNSNQFMSNILSLGMKTSDSQGAEVKLETKADLSFSCSDTDSMKNMKDINSMSGKSVLKFKYEDLSLDLSLFELKYNHSSDMNASIDKNITIINSILNYGHFKGVANKILSTFQFLKLNVKMVVLSGNCSLYANTSDIKDKKFALEHFKNEAGSEKISSDYSWNNLTLNIDQMITPLAFGGAYHNESFYFGTFFNVATFEDVVNAKPSSSSFVMLETGGNFSDLSTVLSFAKELNTNFQTDIYAKLTLVYNKAIEATASYLLDNDGTHNLEYLASVSIIKIIFSFLKIFQLSSLIDITFLFGYKDEKYKFGVAVMFGVLTLAFLHNGTKGFEILVKLKHIYNLNDAIKKAKLEMSNDRFRAVASGKEKATLSSDIIL